MTRKLRIFAVTLALAASARAVQLGDLPGEDITGTQEEVQQGEQKVQAPPPPARGSNWLAPPLDEQLSRDRNLIPLGKGALYVPYYSEPRREPEVSILNAKGELEQTGRPGERIMVDSGSYQVRFGSGTSSQQLQVQVDIGEGHTTVVPPTWGGLIVETLTGDGEYIEGNYELIRMERWINYGNGRGFTEERLQDIKTWIIPAGTYRISKPGEGFNSLLNYITVQINPGELSMVELIFKDKTSGDVVGGGIKSLNVRATAGRNWTYGLRTGGNVILNQSTNEADVRKQSLQFSGDLRTRINFDNVRYFGINEIYLQDIFNKEKGLPFSVTSDIAQLRTTWVRRLTTSVGPYVRGTLDTHLFPQKAAVDRVYLVQQIPAETPGGSVSDTVPLSSQGRDFEVAPSLDPTNFGEGVGVNVNVISKYYLEATTQVGFAGRQTLAQESYVAQSESLYVKGQSVHEIGAEGNLLSTVRLGNQVNLDLRVELFALNGNPRHVHLDDFNADFRFFLSSNLEIGYVYDVQETQTKTKNNYPSTHNISLRLSFNY